MSNFHISHQHRSPLGSWHFLYLDLTCLQGKILKCSWSDYEQQRFHLLHKHGIDLGDSIGIADGKKTKRMDPKEVEMLMGGGEGQGGIFTWREKNRRKVWIFEYSVDHNFDDFLKAGLFRVSNFCAPKHEQNWSGFVVDAVLILTVCCEPFLWSVPHFFLSGPRGHSWPWLFFFLRLVEPWRDYVRMSIWVSLLTIFVNVWITSYYKPRFPPFVSNSVKP